MINAKKVLALIPARGGSKRLPRKNVMELAGKPLIAWSIEAAKRSKYIDTVVVSTDDDEIASISQSFGADVPFRRPRVLASDSATTNDVVLHAISEIDCQYDIVVVLQPTSPLRRSDHIDQSLELLTNKGAEGVVSVTECEHSPLWSNTLPSNANMSEFLRPQANKRSQDLSAYYRLNGAVYSFKTESLLLNEGIAYNRNVYAFIMPSESSCDIDSALDFKWAQFLIQSRYNN